MSRHKNALHMFILGEIEDILFSHVCSPVSFNYGMLCVGRTFEVKNTHAQFSSFPQFEMQRNPLSHANFITKSPPVPLKNCLNMKQSNIDPKICTAYICM